MAKRTYYMKVSIIIPIYKVEPYIERCIQSVLRQTYRNLEVILVDDCTPDRSMEMAKACIEQSPLSKDLQIVYLRHEQNRGLSVARNTGTDAATGEYLMFIDSDDHITDDCVETLVKPLENHPYDIVAADYELHQNGLTNTFSQLGIEGEVMGTPNIARCLLMEKYYCMPWSKIFNTRYIRENKLYFPERLPYEDELWTALVVCTAKSLYAVQKKTYHYELRKGSFVTSESAETYYKGLLGILQHLYKHTEQGDPVMDADAVMMAEERLVKKINNWQSEGLTPFKRYAYLRQCDTRSRNTKLRIHRSVKTIALHFDQYLPVTVGYAYKQLAATIVPACQKTIYGLKLMKHKLHTFLSKQYLKRNAS